MGQGRTSSLHIPNGNEDLEVQVLVHTPCLKLLGGLGDGMATVAHQDCLCLGAPFKSLWQSSREHLYWMYI